MPDFSRLALMIEHSRFDGVDFGTQENAPRPEWIVMAERRLGCSLPPSFKWFLNNYGGGEICGEEIYSIYGPDFESAFGGDVVFQYLAHQRRCTLAPNEIPLATNDDGEIFFMKTGDSENGEYQVWLKHGEYSRFYAATFTDFLETRIVELCNSNNR